MKPKYVVINFPFIVYLFLMFMLGLIMIGLYPIVFYGERFDTYSMGKLIVAAVMYPFMFMLIFSFQTLVSAKGITRLYGFVKKDGSIIGFELESETWDKLSLENVSNGIDLKNKKFIINEGKKKEKIIIDIRSKKYPKFNSTNPFLPGFNSNVPKWFYGEKYIKKYNEQLRLIYKYGKDVCMTPLQAECWYNTFGPFDQNKTDQNSVVSKKHRNI